MSGLRAARPILDRLTAAERRRVAAVVACVAGPSEQGAAAARLAVSALSLGGCRPLHVSGLGGCGVFTALHMACALLGRSPGALVLVIRPGDAGPEAGGCGAVLLGTEGGVACRPLPPARVAPPRNASPETADRLYGLALALALVRGGLRREEVQRVVSPGATVREVGRMTRAAGLAHAAAASADMPMARAATVEAALGAAVQAPPGGGTLVMAREPDGRLGACLLEPA